MWWSGFYWTTQPTRTGHTQSNIEHPHTHSGAQWSTEYSLKYTTGSMYVNTPRKWEFDTIAKNNAHLWAI